MASIHTASRWEMLSKTPTFGQRTTLRQPTIVRRPSDRPEPNPLVSHAAAPLHAPTTAARALEPDVEVSAAAVTEPVVATPAMAMSEDAPKESDSRWARRTPSRLGAQIQHQSLSAAVPCTIRD